MRRSYFATTALATGLFIVFTAGSPAQAQQRNTTGGSINTGSTRGRAPSTFPEPSTTQRPIFITGKVVVSGGGAPPEPVKIERVCNNTVRLEAYTDRKGRFSFEVGRNQEFQDASESANDPFGNPSNTMRGMDLGGGRLSREQMLFGCDLRASLAGFRSDSLPLSNIHYLDNPDVGTIILHRLEKVEGLTVSATSALAPKDARKALEKGEDAMKRNNPDEAQRNFEKAVELYPRYAAAWYNLGRVQEQRDHNAEARKSYQQAVAADDKYIPPRERLAVLALMEQNWEDLLNESDRVIRLDPIEYPDAYYFNSIAQFQLKHFDIAEKQAREAIRLDTSRKNPRAHYVLGLALAQQQQYAASAESLRTYLGASPDSPDAAMVRKQLEQVEQAAQGQTQTSDPTSKATSSPSSQTPISGR